MTFDQITSADAFKSFTLPFPIVTTIQFDPGMCVVGYDNAGFILGTSSFLFNEVECQLLPDGLIALEPDSQNTTSGIVTAINAAIQVILNTQEALTTDNVLFATHPNPFQGSAQSPKDSPPSQLNFVDGDETHQNIPLWPLMQPVRKVDLIFANNNSADTATNFPNGTELMTIYMQALLVGLPFPFIPDLNTFVSQGLNVRPSFFGCNETNVPLVIYLPNTNISFSSGVPTFQRTYSETDTRDLIQNGLNIATRSNSTRWARCVACVIA
jgi:lysophospholipase